MIMNVYEKILEELREGNPSALLTWLPDGPGKLEKQVLGSGSDVGAISDNARNAIEEGMPALVKAEGRTVFVEPVLPKERLIILGGGHIALPLVKFAAETGFAVTIADDRPSFANTSRFPQAERVICESFEDSLDMLKFTEYDYIVVITRGHRHDTLCLRKILSQRETHYLGMIGSRRRVEGVKRLLLDEGFDAERIGRICTPIGLRIGAITPEEIAISILAEIISYKRLGSGRKRINRSELDLAVLDEIVARTKGKAFASVTVMDAKGSVPRGAGAKMLVYPDLSIIGSIGGGCSEGEIIRDAFSMIGTGGHLVKDIDLTGDVAESEGMVCGGIMKVLVEDLSEFDD
ncbi:MAG TPA: XdhC/CoxI family protein [Anaerovoracaceae bacterium]|nr:XdhC/CoxI family protein [Anaerovoracaceae bacterium]